MEGRTSFLEILLHPDESHSCEVPLNPCLVKHANGPFTPISILITLTPLQRPKTPRLAPAPTQAWNDGRSIWGGQLTSWPYPIIWWPSQGCQMWSRRLSEMSWAPKGVLKARESLKSLQGSIHLPKEPCDLHFKIRCAILRNHPTFRVKLV